MLVGVLTILSPWAIEQAWMEVCSLFMLDLFLSIDMSFSFLFFTQLEKKRLNASTSFVNTINCFVKLKVDEIVFIINSDRK